MTRFESLQSKFSGLKKAETAYWDDLYSAAGIIFYEFSRFMKVPPQDALSDKPDPGLIALGKKAGRDFTACGIDEIERGFRKIDFAIALILDPESSETPPNQLTVSLSLSRENDVYQVSVGGMRNKYQVIDGDFSSLNAGIFEYFERAINPVLDIS